MADQQSPPRLPLVVKPENRSGALDKDAKLVNGFFEKVSQAEVFVYKRPGFLYDRSVGVAGAGQGCVNWNGVIYAIVAGTLYKFSGTTPTSIGAVDATGGVYTFTTTLGTSPKLVMNNGVKAYFYDGTTLTQITNVNFPTTKLRKGLAYLNGVTYVITQDAYIQGSGANDPSAWDPLNSILAQIESDQGVAIAKQLVYVIAFKTFSVESFYDAGNPTGSPLGSVQGAKISIGCKTADSVRDMDGTLYWISQSKSGSIGVMQLSQTKSDTISTASVERLIQTADFTTVWSWCFKLSGHRFYGFTIKNSNLTLVYDETTQEWAQWTDQDGNYLPIVAAIDGDNQLPLFQHATNGSFYSLSLDNYSDQWTAGVKTVIPFDLVTPNYDGGVKKPKVVTRLTVVGDRVPGSILQIRVNDFDYASDKWTSFRNIDLGQENPTLTDWGTFKRRATHLRHRGDTPLRLQVLELTNIMLGAL